jgi:hypothetical protein
MEKTLKEAILEATKEEAEESYKELLAEYDVVLLDGLDVEYEENSWFKLS